MTELLFVICLATSPTECEERSLLFADVAPLACLVGAQATLAHWSRRNPGYSIEGWKCRHRPAGERSI